MVGYPNLKIIISAVMIGLGDVSTLVVIKTMTVSRWDCPERLYNVEKHVLYPDSGVEEYGWWRVAQEGKPKWDYTISTRKMRSAKNHKLIEFQEVVRLEMASGL